ncbi:MAG TPA: hypothetical protein VFK05_34450 [Polyangiaceae bacterium]|nr:hypothetical protein [Polyangiaceae bacterium]
MSRLDRLAPPAAATVLLWISRTLFGLLVSYPVFLAVQASSMTAGPDGDAGLFQPGSLLLLELLRLSGPWLLGAARLALLLLGLSALFELVPFAMALDMLRLPIRPLRQRFQRAMRLFPSFFSLGAIALLGQAGILLAASLLGAALRPALASVDERLRTLAPLSLIGLGLIACGAFGGALDIARATLVRRAAHDDGEGGARAALARALFCLRQRPLQVLVGLYPSVAGSALSVLAAAWLLTRFVSQNSSGRALALTFGLHQLATLFALAWRVRWLGTALELSAESD